MKASVLCILLTLACAACGTFIESGPGGVQQPAQRLRLALQRMGEQLHTEPSANIDPALQLSRRLNGKTLPSTQRNALSKRQVDEHLVSAVGCESMSGRSPSLCSNQQQDPAKPKVPEGCSSLWITAMVLA